VQHVCSDVSEKHATSTVGVTKRSQPQKFFYQFWYTVLTSFAINTGFMSLAWRREEFRRVHYTLECVHSQRCESKHLKVLITNVRLQTACVAVHSPLKRCCLHPKVLLKLMRNAPACAYGFNGYAHCFSRTFKKTNEWEMLNQIMHRQREAEAGERVSSLSLFLSHTGSRPSESQPNATRVKIEVRGTLLRTAPKPRGLLHSIVQSVQFSDIFIDRFRVYSFLIQRLWWVGRILV
jgi:hypothetical protein